MQTSRSPIEMDHPSRWLALLRIVIGVYFGKAIWTKMTIAVAGGMVPYPAVQQRWIETMPKIVAKQASENPLLFYKSFLEQTVLTNAEAFAKLTAWGEVVVGVGLTLGLFTGVAALAGLWLSLNYGLATQWISTGHQGFHLLLVTSMLIFFLARAGRAWGLDGWLARRFGDRWFTRRPFS